MRTVVTRRSARVCLAVCSMETSSSSRCRRTSWPSSMFCDDVQVVAQRQVLVDGRDARASVASGASGSGPGGPARQVSPCVGSQMPAMRLDQGGLARAVVPDQGGHLPGRDVEVTPVSACTGPKLLPMPRSCSSGLAHGGGAGAGAGRARPASAGRAPSSGLPVTTGCPGWSCDSVLSRDTGCGAGLGERARAQLGGRHELVRDDGRVHVRGRDPLRRQQDRRDRRSWSAGPWSCR